MRILMLRTNDRWHDYLATTKVIADHFQQNKGWTVRQESSLDVVREDVLSETDVVVVGGGYMTWAGGEELSQGGRESLERFIARGGALIVLHGGVGCFETWDLYQKLAGRVWERDVSYHPPYNAVHVQISRPNHPSIQGIRDFTLQDELYYLSQTGSLTPVAFAEHEGKREPVAWTSTYEQGRIFGCSLGHDVTSVSHPGYLALITSGIEWARPGSRLPAACVPAVTPERDPADKVKIGLVGAGGIANSHAAGYNQYTDYAQVVAIAEPDETRAQAMKDRLGGDIRLYSHWDALLEDDEVEAVDICLPHHLHESAGVAAAQAGKHVLMEKPIARNLKEADAIIEACDQAGVRLMVAQDRRFHPVFKKVKELIDSGIIGRIICVRLDHNQNLMLPEGHWIRDKEKLGGGAIMSCLVHQFDAMRWFAGEVAQVACMSLTWPDRMEGEVIGAVPMRFRSGAVGDALINWAVRGRAPQNGTWGELIWITGEKGSIHNVGGVFVREDDGVNTKDFQSVSVPAGNGHTGAVQHFVDCIRLGQEPLVNGREGRATLEVAIAAYESEEHERFVHLPID